MPKEKLHFSSVLKSTDPSIYFKVREAPLCYWSNEQFDIARWLSSGNNLDMPLRPAVQILNKTTLINDFTNEFISIVDNKFSVIEHAAALQIASEVFLQVFGKIPLIHHQQIFENGVHFEAELINPECKIILTRNGVRTTYDENRVGYDTPSLRDSESMFRANKQEAIQRIKFLEDEYFPFVRVSNYLRRGSNFKVEIGYYRYKCSNGMLMGKRTKYTFSSNYSNTSYLRLQEQALYYFRNIRKYLLKPMETMWRMLHSELSRENLIYPALYVFQDDLLRLPYKKRLEVIDVLKVFKSRYFDEIGENYNAGLNIATDLAHLIYAKQFDLNFSQAITGEWLKYWTSKRFNEEEMFNEAKSVLKRLSQEVAIEVVPVDSDEFSDEDAPF